MSERNFVLGFILLVSGSIALTPFGIGIIENECDYFQTLLVYFVSAGSAVVGFLFFVYGLFYTAKKESEKK